MTAPCEQPIFGPTAAFAATLATALPVIETARLHLRAPRLADFDAWAEILCGPSGPFMGGPFDRDEAYVEFAAACGSWLLRGHGVMAVEAKSSGKVLGFVMIGFEPGDQEPELGYLFRAVAEGQGYASEAARALRDHAFAAMGMDRLVSYIDPKNIRSSRLAARLGARREGQHDGCEVWVHRAARPNRVDQGADTSSNRGE